MLNMMVVFVLWYAAGASSIYIPVAYDSRGLPVVNFTVAGASVEDDCALPMTIKFSDRTGIGLPYSAGLFAHLNTRNNGRLPMIDPSIYFHAGYGPESILSIRKGGWIRNTFGAIAFTGNDLVLNSSRNEFIQSCEPGSNMTVFLDDSPMDDRVPGGNVRTRDGRFSTTEEVEFLLVTFWDRSIASVPIELLSHIHAELIRNGAYRVAGPRSLRQLIMASCHPTMLASLPEIVIRLGSISEIVLAPADYIQMIPEREECIVNLRPPINGGFYSLSPLIISGLNFRLSNDLLEICDSNTI
jgi:hypothetical protein